MNGLEGGRHTDGEVVRGSRVSGGLGAGHKGHWHEDREEVKGSKDTKTEV